jgi:hypothetical protein
MHRVKFYFCEMHPEVALAGKTPMWTLEQRPVDGMCATGTHGGGRGRQWE